MQPLHPCHGQAARSIRAHHRFLSANPSHFHAAVVERQTYARPFPALPGSASARPKRYPERRGVRTSALCVWWPYTATRAQTSVRPYAESRSLCTTAMPACACSARVRTCPAMGPRTCLITQGREQGRRNFPHHRAPTALRMPRQRSACIAACGSQALWIEQLHKVLVIASGLID